MRTAIAHGKFKRQGRFIGQRSDWKKAYVKLRDGREDSGVPGRRIASSRPAASHGLTSWKLEAGSFKDQETCLFANTIRRRQAAGSRPCRCSTRSPTSEPYKPLIEPLRKSGGRNNHGELTSWWRGGGHKRNYRIIDFKRDKADIPATVSTVEYDPNRSARIALLTYADGEKRYILQPAGREGRRHGRVGRSVDILPGNALPLKNVPLGTMVHNVELKPGKGGQIARSAGSAVQVVAKEGDYASVKMPSGEIRKINVECLATDRPGRQRRPRERVDRQGRPEPVARQAAARPRRGDEPGRSPARRRRRQDLRRPSPGVAVGPAEPRDTRRATASRPIGSSCSGGRSSAWSAEMAGQLEAGSWKLYV